MTSAPSAPAPHTPARPALLLAAGPAVTATALGGVLLLLQSPAPVGMIALSRAIPALVSLLVLLPALRRSGGLPGVLRSAWGLGPGRGGVRGCILVSTVTAAAVTGIHALTAALAATMGALTADPSGLGAAAVVLTAVLPLAVLGALGEEVVWRSHLPRTVGGSFWKRSAVVALAWTGFQAPLLLTAVLQDALSASVAAAVLLLLLPLSLLLSALAARQGSVWPAAVAHALILAVIVAAPGVATIDPLGLGAVVLIGSALMGSAAMGIAPAAAAAHARPPALREPEGTSAGTSAGAAGAAGGSTGTSGAAVRNRTDPRRTAVRCYPDGDRIRGSLIPR